MALAFAAVFSTMATAAPSAVAAPVDPRFAAAEGATVALVARERAAAGLGRLAIAADLTAVARRHATTMAAQNTLYHNPTLQQEVLDWQSVGENVGRGGSVDKVHEAFMASPTHRREILGPRFTEIGVGVIIAGSGVVWVVEVFRMRAVATTVSGAPTDVAVASTVPATTGPPAAVTDQSEPATATTIAARVRRARPTTTTSAAPTTPLDRPPESAPAQAEAVVEALGTEVAAAAGSRPAAPGTRAAQVAAGSPAPREPLPPLPVGLAGVLLAGVVAGQVRTARRLRAG